MKRFKGRFVREVLLLMVLATVASDSVCAVLCTFNTSGRFAAAETCHGTSQSPGPTLDQGTPEDVCPGNHLAPVDPLLLARPSVVLGSVSAMAPVAYAVTQVQLVAFVSSAGAHSSSPPGFSLALRI